jgi:class 3 adenylate cyclase
MRFCSACGTTLAGAAAPAQRSDGPVAERRVCSILFCDLVGFTPLSESRDPEEVERYGGMVEKFIGDAVMAVWGTPMAVEGWRRSGRWCDSDHEPVAQLTPQLSRRRQRQAS